MPALQRHRENIKRGILAVAFVAVITAGTLTGAQLKTDKDKKQAIREFRQAPIADQVAALEERKAFFLQQEAQLQRTVDEFRKRVQQPNAGSRDGG